MEKELETYPCSRDKVAKAREKAVIKGLIRSGKSKKIIGLCCGKKYGMCETHLRAAAMGAAEFGMEMEIIQASKLAVKMEVLSRGKIAPGRRQKSKEWEEQE